VSFAVTGVADVQEAVRTCPEGRRLLPVAGGTKSPLSTSARDDVDLLDVSGLAGLVEYDPAELTFTALAATPVADVAEVLAKHGQYLPFDPPLTRAGATLGGTVAAGASGPNAMRHGTLRDFVIGVRFVDGLGRLVNGGGRVVKNAAGFDLPKLMVGSIGRLGVITQLSFKVFPRPRETVTLEFRLPDIPAAIRAACAVSASPRQVDAVDVLPDNRVLVRLGGDPEVLSQRAEHLAASGLAGELSARHGGDAELALWNDAAELRRPEDGAALVRVPVTSHTAVKLAESVAAGGGETRFSLGVNVGWVSWPQAAPLDDLDQVLRETRVSGQVMFGESPEPLIGMPVANPFGTRVRRALDPNHRFLEV